MQRALRFRPHRDSIINLIKMMKILTKMINSLVEKVQPQEEITLKECKTMTNMCQEVAHLTIFMTPMADMEVMIRSLTHLHSLGPMS